MLRALLKLALVVIVLVVLAAYLLGYRWSGDLEVDTRAPAAIDAPDVDTSRAREAGAEIAESVAEGANRAQAAVASASLTAKIKAKMSLDDTVSARRIDVDTTGSVVTVSGVVASESERTRAIQLARETDGVTQVVDDLQVRP